MPKRELLRKIDQRVSNWVSSAAAPNNPGAAYSYASSAEVTAYSVSAGAEGRVSSIFYPLQEPLIAYAWDWNNIQYSDVAVWTKVDLASEFGTPIGIKAVLLNITIFDTGSGTDEYFKFAPYENLVSGSFYVRCAGAQYASATIVMPCDPNGNIWYQVNASGTNTMYILMHVWGYWI